MSKRFYFGSPSDSDDDGDALPYPEPLPRQSFLVSDFTPTQFLSSLEDRHQTLEDLRAELRGRSQELSKELLDLVNDNYQEFLGLGSDLKGGDEKVEEVRVGLVGFKREIDGLREKTTARRQEAGSLVSERQSILRQIRVGRDLLEIDARLDEIEEALGIKSTHQTELSTGNPTLVDLDLSDESSGDEGGPTVAPVSRLERRIEQFLAIQRLVKRVGPDHPFVSQQKGRMDKVKQILLLDLASGLQENNSAGNHDRTLRILNLYNVINESSGALAGLKASK